jgi:hypothetical protein
VTRGIAHPPELRAAATCADTQLATLRLLLNTTPRYALSVAEWHALGQDYASDLEHP